MSAEIEKTSQDYGKFLNIDLQSKLEPINEKVDNFLARLDEFQIMLNFAQNERVAALETMAALEQHTVEFNELCGRIDKVEELIGHIKGNLNTLEESIVKAEEEMGCAEVNVTSIFTPLFLQKKTGDAKETPQLGLFKTDEYFK